MNHEATILDHDLKLANRKTMKNITVPCSRIALQPREVKSSVHPVTIGSESSWKQRIRSLFLKLSKGLEGDQEYHKYLGM